MGFEVLELVILRLFALNLGIPQGIESEVPQVTNAGEPVLPFGADRPRLPFEPLQTLGSGIWVAASGSMGYGIYIPSFGWPKANTLGFPSSARFVGQIPGFTFQA